MTLFPDLALPADQWSAWYRPRRGQPWQLIAEGDCEEDCRRQLAEAHKGGGDYLILSPGRPDPNDRAQ